MCLLTGLKKLKKKLFCKNWTEDWWKSRQCPQKTLKDLQKALRTTAQNHFKKLKKSCLEGKYKEMQGDSRLLHSNVYIKVWNNSA